ncbi:phosphatase PAP2 family protein [Streptomyces sp. NPDC048564]|uniref:phosphatase PAP2 family protein n=1 Tax=Streptomyces sp. NPDC048564 TaxID=3155760 RepID=UPI003415E82A
MAWLGRWRGRRTAASGMAALAVAQLVPNGLRKQLADRPRPPKEWFPHDEVDDRPDSSSFPSGHTAAAVASPRPWHPRPAAGAWCAVPAAMVALERVQSGAHHASDVVTGGAIGMAGAWSPTGPRACACATGPDRSRARGSRRPARVPTGLQNRKPGHGVQPAAVILQPAGNDGQEQGVGGEDHPRLLPIRLDPLHRSPIRQLFIENGRDARGLWPTAPTPAAFPGPAPRMRASHRSDGRCSRRARRPRALPPHARRACCSRSLRRTRRPRRAVQLHRGKETSTWKHGSECWALEAELSQPCWQCCDHGV